MTTTSQYFSKVFSLNDPSKLLLICALILFNQSSVAVETSVSGYARVVSGIIDDSNVSYHGYDDELSFDQDSLLGLQGQLKINEQLSVTALGVAHSNSDRDSGIEWLYLNYRPISDIQVKLGQMRTPFYSKSDVLNVGYAYPWIVVPKELYTDYIFDEFQGIDIRYSYFSNHYSTFLEIYYGEFDDEITVNSTKYETKVENLQGIIGELKLGGFNYRLSFHKGDSNLELQLDQFASNIQLAGFEQTADSLKTEGPVEFYQVGIEYDSLDYFIISEWTRIKPRQKLFPDITSYYLTLGQHINAFTYLVTFGSRKDDLDNMDNDIPIGLNPALDQLSAGYQLVVDSRQQDDVTSWTLGLRWDLRYDTALKIELKNVQVEGNSSSTFKIKEGQSFDRESNIALFGLEWVF